LSDVFHSLTVASRAPNRRHAPRDSPRNFAAPTATSMIASLTSLSSLQTGQRSRYSSGGGPKGSSRPSCGSGAWRLQRILPAPYGFELIMDHTIGRVPDGPAGASVQKHTVLNNSLSDNNVPERKCERQNNARILLVNFYFHTTPLLSLCWILHAPGPVTRAYARHHLRHSGVDQQYPFVCCDIWQEA
jgi:hypothetical protein